MLYVLQENISERRYQVLLEVFERFKLPYVKVKVIPFSNTLIPEVNHDGNIVAFGSTTLMRIAEKRGWNPGCFFNDNFKATVWLEKYKGHCLNDDSVICKFKDVPLNRDRFFIRPVDDLKQFTGLVVTKEEYLVWRENVLKLDRTELFNADTLVCVAEPKEILKEFRYFIVDEEIVGKSIYKMGGKLITSLPVDRDVDLFVSGRCFGGMSRGWSPHDVFVIDVAEVAGGDYKIVEINCANSAGFYNCNISDIVLSIDSLCEKMEDRTRF